MSIDTNLDHFNIYLKNNNAKEHVLKESSSYEKYIILQNETLQIENRKFLHKMNELKKQINEIEDEIDKFDTSKRYTKGLLKNLVELEKLRNTIASNETNLYKNITDSHNKYFKNNKYMLRGYGIFSFILFSILFEIELFNIIHFFILLSHVIFNFFLFEKINKNIQEIKCPENIELELKVKKIKDSQDFLSDYIDNI
jgi:hypothetical protein